MAKRILHKYDKNRDGILDEKEMISMMIDGYRTVSQPLNPSHLDVLSYGHMLDKDCDGKVTLEDLQQTCLRFLHGPL
jgi:Ca2+-binding EF-hand superfamily protein